MHLYLEIVARALNEDGHTMQDVMKAITKMEVKPTKQLMKDGVWKQILLTLFGLETTTKQTNEQIQDVYETMNKWLGQWFQIHVPFPDDNIKSLEQYDKYIENTKRAQNFGND